MSITSHLLKHIDYGPGEVGKLGVQIPDEVTEKQTAGLNRSQVETWLGRWDTVQRELY